MALLSSLSSMSSTNLVFSTGWVGMSSSFVPIINIMAGGEDSLNLTAALRDIYTTMDKGSTIPPIVLLQVLHMAFPRFAERGENGGYQQQDANECWVEVLRMLQVAKTIFNF